MRIGLGQIIVLIVLVLLLFGKFPKVLKDLTLGLQNFKKEFTNSEKRLIEDSSSNDVQKIEENSSQSDKKNNESIK